MDLEGRRTSYSIARVLEEVKEQKTKEEELRQSWLGGDGDFPQTLPASSSESVYSKASRLTASRSSTCKEENEAEELAFQPGFVHQLLGKFGGSKSNAGPAASPGRLRKVASAQDLATTSAGGASPAAAAAGRTTPVTSAASLHFGVVLRHPEKARGGGGGGSGYGVSGNRRRSQDGSVVVFNGNSLPCSANSTGGSPSPTISSSSSSPSFSSASKSLSSSSSPSVAGGHRVLIIPKASAPPVVKRLQQQQQQQQQQQYQQNQQQQLKQEKELSEPSQAAVKEISSTKSFVTKPSDDSLPIKNMVKAKRSVFEQQKQQQQSSSPGTQHQPVIGRACTTRQLVPRPVEIVSASSSSSPTTKPTLSSSPLISRPLMTPTSSVASTTPSPSAIKPSSTSILPSKPVISALASKKSTPKPPPPSEKSTGNGDGYGFGLPVPQLKSSLPFNGEKIKRVELSERAVTAMRKAGKSWFFGTDVAAAPEGTIAVKLTPNSRPFALAEEGDDVAHGNGYGGGYHDDELTAERRAQTTVWDHVRNADSSQQRVDPGLAAEARRLIASGGEDDDEAKEFSSGVISRNKSKKMVDSFTFFFLYPKQA